MRFIQSLIILIFTPVLLFGQTNTGSISGKLVDGSNNPVSYATVTLLRADSSVVNGDLSKDDGTFKIAPSGIGTFTLRIESIGMTKKYLSVTTSEAESDKRLGAIKLESEQTTLKEVSVVGEKRVMELKVDKKVFNVEKNITTAGGSATDVLQNVPSVSVAADGTVSLRGNAGVTILIDGKPATMFGADVNSALQSLPAGSIESVEVLTNPSAKYDASGTGGIINIITKKDGHFGINGSVTGGAGTNDKYNGNLSLNARKGKWNVFLNSSARQNHTYNNVITDRSDKQPDASADTALNGHTHSYYTYEHVPRTFAGVFNTIGATFDPDKYNSITVTENINRMGFSFRDYSDYFMYNDPDRNGMLMQRNRSTDFAVDLFSISSAIDYKHKFKKKDEELSVDATYATTDISRKQHFTTQYLAPTAAADLGRINQNAPGSGGNSSFNAWADYTNPLFTKNGKLGLGVKSQIFWFNTTSNPTVDTQHATTTQPVIDYTLLGDYNYTQQIHAAYVNWNDQVGKFSYQLGLRVEDAIYDGTGKLPYDTTFHNSFANLFPSAFISYQLPDQQSIYLNYSRRVNRPGFMQLLPFKDFSNPGTVNMGNPALLPEFINNIEFSYNKTDDKGNNFIVSAYYAYTENLIQKVTRPITLADTTLGLGNEIGSLLSQPVNIASGITYGLEGTGRWQILPIWDATLNVNFFQNELVVGKSSPYAKYLSDNNGSSWFGKLNTNLKLPKNFSLQINGNYESPKVIAQGSVEDSWWVDVAVKKNFWKNKASLTLNCSDIFNTHRFITNYNLPAYSEVINRVRETRIGNITFTYRFGKSDFGKGGGPGAGKKEKMMPDNKSKPAKPSDEDRLKNLKENDDNDQPGGGGGGQGQGGGRKEGGGK